MLNVSDLTYSSQPSFEALLSPLHRFFKKSRLRNGRGLAQGYSARVRARLDSRTVPLHCPSPFLSMKEWMNEAGDAYEMTHPNPSSPSNTASHQPLLEVPGTFLILWLVPSRAGINLNT